MFMHPLVLPNIMIRGRVDVSGRSVQSKPEQTELHILKNIIRSYL